MRRNRGPPDGRLVARRRSGSRIWSRPRDRAGRIAALPLLPRGASRGPAETLGPSATGWSNGNGTAFARSSIRRRGQTWLWSRGEELITHRFPEIAAAATHLPDGTVLDGEVLAFRDGRPMPFSALQQRIGRQKQVAQIMRSVPVVFMVYDILEHDGLDIRDRPLRLSARRAGRFARRRPRRACSSPEVESGSWDELRGAPPRVARSRRRRLHAEAPRLRLRCRAPTGRLVEVEDRSAHHRCRPHLRAAWQRQARQPADRLHIRRMGRGPACAGRQGVFGIIERRDRGARSWIRRHTLERHGPVRVVEPIQVFELGFEAIAASGRHRSGIAVRFPRMLRWRRDKTAPQADTLEAVRRLMQ